MVGPKSTQTRVIWLTANIDLRLLLNEVKSTQCLIYDVYVYTCKCGYGHTHTHMNKYCNRFWP